MVNVNGSSVKVVHKQDHDPTEVLMQLTVETTWNSDSQEDWNKAKIIRSIVEETSLAETTATSIAESVEARVLATQLEVISTATIREMIDMELIDRGYRKAQRQYATYGIPHASLESLLFGHNKENANQSPNPESINLSIAETILKEYALREVFDSEVAEAHRKGEIHLHDLGFVDRPYCGGHSLEYIKKYGLNLPNITSVSAPAKHPAVLVGHMVKMASVLQGYYAGAVGWDAVNIFFAPFFKGMEYAEIKQIAQMLIFEFNQLAGSRGSQVVFSDFNLYLGVPKHFRDTPVIGPGGVYTGETYADYEIEAKAFLQALLEVYLEGDHQGKTFFFPKPLLHLDEESTKAECNQELINLACKLASKQGITYFVFDRGEEVSVSQCCRLKLQLDEKDLEDTKRPERLRFSALQNVTINLPRVAYSASGGVSGLGKKVLPAVDRELERAVELVVQAHLNKRRFIRKLLSLGSDGPLSLFSLTWDGKPYLQVDRLTYLCGVLGLNEMVQHILGQQLHESEEAYKLGMRLIVKLKKLVEKHGQEAGLRLVLEESPAESACYRLASMDLKEYPEAAKEVLRGNVETKDYYYTNSVHYAYDADINYIDRIIGQSKFHPLIDAGAIIHVWLGEQEPEAASIRNLVEKVLLKTECTQLAFSPEFTICEDCKRTYRGLSDKCPSCDSDNVYHVTRIVGYFSKIENWNKAKRAELIDRKRGI